MGHYQVTTPAFGFHDHSFGSIECAEDAGAFPTRIAGKQSCIIIRFLQVGVCLGFECTDDIYDLHGMEILNGKSIKNNTKP